MRCKSLEQAIAGFRQMMKEMDLKNPVVDNREEEINMVSTSVNLVRLKINPVSLENGAIYQLYGRIVN